MNQYDLPENEIKTVDPWRVRILTAVIGMNIGAIAVRAVDSPSLARVNKLENQLDKSAKDLRECKNTCQTPSSYYDTINSSLASFELSDTDRDKIANVLKNECRVSGITDDHAYFDSANVCYESSFQPESMPYHDYISRENFYDSLDEYEESLISSMEQRDYKYD